MKKCSSCNELKELTCFHIHKNESDGLSRYCKSCTKVKSHAIYLLKREKILKQSKDYYSNNIDKARAARKSYRAKNKTKVNKLAMERYYANWKESRMKADESAKRNWSKRLVYHKKWKAEKRRNDYSYRLHSNISRRLRESLNENLKNGKSWELLLGYTVQDLVKHIESLFKPYMSWGNYGAVWHIDHIIPINHFKLTGKGDDEVISKCWSLSNLQPLLARDNLIKKDKLIYQ